jgi:PAS domain S-box-containing protein
MAVPMIPVDRAAEPRSLSSRTEEPLNLQVWRAFVSLVVTAGGGVLLVSLRDLVRHPVGTPWFVLVGLTVGTGWATLRMRRVPVTFSISDTFTIAAALLFGPAAGTVIVVVDVLVMSLRIAAANRSDLWFRVLINVTATALAMWLSAQTFFAISMTGPLAEQPGTIREVVGPLALFAAMYFFLNTGLIAVAVAHERHAPIATVWRQHFSALWLTYFGGASIAGVLVLMTATRIVDVKTLTLVLPLLFILHVTYKAAIDRVHEQVEHLTRIAVYAAALRSTTDAVIVTDRDGRVTLINPTAERLTGSTERDAAGQSAADILRTFVPPPRPDEEPLREADRDAMREFVLVRPDGRELPIEKLESAIRDDAGEVVGTIVTFRDISARKAIDAERDALLARERSARSAADAANRLKDEFLATLSHELRTPANGILGWTRLLKSGRLDQPQTQQALDALERSARAQATLLDDLLDMSRIVRGTLRINPHPVAIEEPLRSAIDTVTPAIRSKGIDLRVTVAPDVPSVHADPDRLRQVFWNLLSNAVKFTGAGGSIVISVTHEFDDVRVEVADTGSGIDAEALPYIFDRFRQADGSTTRPHGGLGLGLAIVRNIVEAHGGTVSASSAGRGFGASFVIALPAISSSR